MRPRTKIAGVKWVVEAEVYVKAEPGEEGKGFQRTHGSEFRECG